MIATSNPDLARPAGLSDLGNRAYDAIVAYLAAHGIDYTGGCRAFYSPEEWQARGENYCTKAHLVVVYDGGSLGELIQISGAHYEGGRRALEAVGVYAEEGTHWYGGIYEIDTSPCTWWGGR